MRHRSVTDVSCEKYWRKEFPFQYKKIFHRQKKEIPIPSCMQVSFSSQF